MLQTANADTKTASARGNSRSPATPRSLVAPALAPLSNRAMLRLQRKCDCGDAPDCKCEPGDRKKDKESPQTALHRKSSGVPPGSASAVLDAGTESFFEARLQRKAAVRTEADNSRSPIRIGAVNDPLEAEADRVAERVMRMAEPQVSISPAAPRISRKCVSCEDEEKKLRKNGDGRTPELNEAPPVVHEVLTTPGQPLDRPTRDFFEPRLGYDLSGIRVHTDARAARSAQSVQAHAYAVSQHIAFGPGKYAPSTTAGRTLLAHELAHAVQQGAGRALRRDFDSTISICERLLRSRTFHVDKDSVSVTLHGTLQGPDNQDGSPTAACAGSYFFISLEKLGLVGNSEIGTHPVPYGARVTRTWDGLGSGDYQLVIWSSNTYQYCCLKGDISVQTPAPAASAAPAAATPGATSPAGTTPSAAYEACYDGDQLYVNKGGVKISCPALTGSVGDPTPPGQYCVRPQGTAQVGGGLKGRLLQDRSKWFLLEPQFATSRSRMMLHPGVMSSGCITVMDKGCFDRLAAVLNGGATSSASGYDGYPPGNTDGVQNPQKSVPCAGMLNVTGQIGGCGPTATPTAPVLQRQSASAPAPTPAAGPTPAAAPTSAPAPAPAPGATADPGAWLTLFPRNARGDSAKEPHITLKQSKTPVEPELQDESAGGMVGPLSIPQQAARDSIVAARAALPAVNFTLGSFTGGYGYQYGGKTPVQPSPPAPSGAKPGAGAAADPGAQRALDVRKAIFAEVTESEGGASAINAYDSAKLTWGPGLAMTGPLPATLTRAFADPKTHAYFLAHGVDWAGGSFLVFNEAANSVETGSDALTLIQGRKDLLSIFVAAAESPGTAQNVVDTEMRALDERIKGIPAKMRDDWDLDVLRVAFHMNHAAPAFGFSTHPANFVACNGDIMAVMMTWGRFAAGTAEASGAWMISSPGSKLTIPQFQKWGHGVAWQKISQVCPVPVAIHRDEIKDPKRVELKDLLLIRTLEDNAGEPRGFYILPKPPVPAAVGTPAPATSDPQYYTLFELNGLPAQEQIGRVAKYKSGELDAIIQAWDGRGLSGAFGKPLGLILKAVRIKSAVKKPAKGPNPDAAALIASDDFVAVQTSDPAAAKKVSDYLGL